MTSSEFLDKLLPSYKEYYDLISENILPPFKAEAKFVSHVEQYFLVHSAKLSDIDSTEHLYFAAEENLSLEKLSDMAKLAWEDGLKDVVPYYGHRNSDVTVIVVCDSADEDVAANVKKIRYSKTYKFMIYGWSNFKLVVVDLKSGKVFSNGQGAETKGFIRKFMKKCSL
ncbi:MAG: hypothetical protein MJ183_00530 [Treponemataceae bacterium]|nr:hypothetical protein [Treponemataceae bacterium]